MDPTKEMVTEPEAMSPELRLAPPVDVYENSDELLMLVDLPGVEQSTLGLRLDGAQLELEARQAGWGNGGAQPLVFARSFKLPHGIDHNGVSAELNKGVLTIRLRKSEAAKPRRIEVKAS
jgi:HSP20 family molecular chaperone IbpA